jgi:hypothetical protein
MSPRRAEFEYGRWPRWVLFEPRRTGRGGRPTAAPDADGSPADLFGFGPRTQALRQRRRAGVGLRGHVLATRRCSAERACARSRSAGRRRISAGSRGRECAGPAPADGLRARSSARCCRYLFGGLLEDRIALGLGAHAERADRARTPPVSGARISGARRPRPDAEPEPGPGGRPGYGLRVGGRRARAGRARRHGGRSHRRRAASAPSSTTS